MEKTLLPLDFWRNNRTAALSELVEFLRIPSISALPDHHEHVLKAATVVGESLTAIGMNDVKMRSGKGEEYPLITAEWMGASGMPTVLLYAHYDVQPVDPIDKWTTLPFEPTVRDGKLFARGAADDKGQLWLMIKTLQGFLKTKGALPVNVKVIFEGEEESGGHHIDRFVRENPEFLHGVTSVLVLDSGMFAPGLPTINNGLRGIITAELKVTTLTGDQHSGLEGGVAPNAAEALAQIVAACKSKHGRVRIPGFYRSVLRPGKAELDSWRNLPFDEADHLRRLGAKAFIHPSDRRYSVLQRQGALPTLEINGIAGGFAGAGFKTVIPAQALAKISMRLVPGMDPDATADAFVRFVEKVTPAHATSEVAVLHKAEAFLVGTEDPSVQAAVDAFRETFNADTAFVRCGGSIPIAAAFKEVLGVPVVITGFTLPDANLHAPDENMPVENFHLGVEAVGRYLVELAKRAR